MAKNVNSSNQREKRNSDCTFVKLQTLETHPPVPFPSLVHPSCQRKHESCWQLHTFPPKKKEKEDYYINQVWTLNNYVPPSKKM